jgi:hypothetical protein
MKILPIAMHCFVLAFAANAVAEDAVGDEEDEGDGRPVITVINDGLTVDIVKPEEEMFGTVLELSAFNYFSIGFGFYMTVAVSGRYSANSFGLLTKYKTPGELHSRLYWDYHLFVLLLGGSGIMATNFDKITFGAAPHIGLGLGYMKMFYRYNFYLDNSFNCHEIVLQFPC